MYTGIDSFNILISTTVFSFILDDKESFGKTVSHSEISVNLEMNTKVVDWTDVLQTEHNDLNLNSKDSNHVKGVIKEEISDNIFTNTFFSASKISQNKEEKQASKTNSKPKKNILNINKRKIIKTYSNSKKQIVTDNKEPLSKDDLCVKPDLSPKNTSEKICDNQQLTDEKESTNGKNVQDKSVSVYNSSNYDGDVSHCNGSLEETLLEEVKGFKKEIKNCYHENGDLFDSKVSYLKNSVVG